MIFFQIHIWAENDEWSEKLSDVKIFSKESRVLEIYFVVTLRFTQLFPEVLQSPNLFDVREK